MNIYEKKSTSRAEAIEVSPQMRIKVLDEQSLEKIHEATLTILEKTGVKFPSETALRVFSEAGAKVDPRSQIVKFPRDLLMKSIANAPRSFTMASRSVEDLDLHLDGTKTYYGTDGTGLTVVDLDDRTRRASRKKDVAMMALVSDYLSSIAFYWPIVSAGDCASQVMPLHELEASFVNTEKHVHIITCTEPETARYAVEMATVVTDDVIRRRPPLSLLVCATSPLIQHRGSLDAALIFAEAGLPAIFCAMPVVGSTGPASITGTMALGNAEILSALCLIQLVHPGAPVCYALFHDMINPMTGQCWASAPNKAAFHAAVAELGHYYNLPVMSGCGATDAHEPDSWKTGKDNAIDALFTCLTGPELIPSLGLLEAYTVLYPEKILFDNEIFNSVKAMTEGVRVDSETLAIDEIMAVGPGGHFLDRDYTCENIRKFWRPEIAHQWSPHEGDFRDPQEVAVEKIRWIMRNHKPRPLDEVARRELGRIIRAAEGELVY